MRTSFFVLLIIFFFLPATAFTQNVNGKWYGVGNVYSNSGETNDYLSELILQQTGTKVSGLYNYFFKDQYISSQIKGTYNPSSRLLVIHLMPLLNYSAKGASDADCSMVGAFTLKISKVDAQLNGAFTPTNIHKFSCPDILIKFTKSNAEGILTKIEKKPLMLEGETDGIPVVQPVIVKTEARAEMKIDKKPEPVADLNKRRFTLKEIDIYSDSVSVSLYDNSEVDYDTISLFYNKKLIAYRQMLSARPIKFMLAVDSLEEISMFAENLGKLPPNTALLLVYDGDIRHEIHITSDYVVNGTVRFRKRKNKPLKLK